MKRDINGFSYPVIDMKLCCNCGLCDNICQIKSEINYEKIDEHMNIKLYCYISHDKNVLSNSSSGGAFTAISDLVLKNGGVVAGAVMDKNFNVYHTIAKNSDERNMMRRSKYVESNICNVYSDLIDYIRQEKEILFTGTPCQVEGFKKFCLVKKLSLEKVILCSLVCHGVASPKIWKDYIYSFQKKIGKNIESINFKDKSKGYLKTVFSASVDGKYYILKGYDSLFHSTLCNRKSCFHCRYATLERSCDITIGDFWNIKNFFDIGMDEGVSLILTHTKKGDRIVHESCHDGNFNVVENNYKGIDLSQALNKPYDKPLEYDIFWNDYTKYGIDYVEKKYTSLKFIDRVKRKCRRLWLRVF